MAYTLNSQAPRLRNALVTARGQETFVEMGLVHEAWSSGRVCEPCRGGVFPFDLRAARRWRGGGLEVISTTPDIASTRHLHAIEAKSA